MSVKGLEQNQYNSKLCIQPTIIVNLFDSDPQEWKSGEAHQTLIASIYLEEKKKLTETNGWIKKRIETASRGMMISPQYAVS